MSILVPSRRGLLGAFLGLIAAPAVVKAESLMKVVAWKPQAGKASMVAGGWLECNGAELSAAAYPELFAKIGATFGGNNENTTFNLPDLRGRPIPGRLSEGRLLAVPLVSGINPTSNGSFPVGMIRQFRAKAPAWTREEAFRTVEYGSYSGYEEWPTRIH